MAVGVQSTGQVIHLAGVACLKPLLKAMEAGRVDSLAHTEMAESEAPGLVSQCFRKLARGDHVAWKLCRRQGELGLLFGRRAHRLQ